MSLKSRLRAGWAFGQAECVWHSMLLLSWREFPPAPSVKRTLAALRKRMRRRGFSFDGWILEFQRRGAPHFHLFIADDSPLAAQLDREKWRTVDRDGHATQVSDGPTIRRIIADWIELIGDYTEETDNFQNGGICERMRNPDGAGRYVAKEAAKRNQKELPEKYAEGVGRWWWLHPRLTPRSRKSEPLDLASYPFPRPYSMVYQTEWLTQKASAKTKLKQPTQSQTSHGQSKPLDFRIRKNAPRANASRSL